MGLMTPGSRGGGTDFSNEVGPSVLFFYTEFLSINQNDIAGAAVGSGASNTIPGDPGDSYTTHPGVAISSTGTTISGVAGLYLNPFYYALGGGKFLVETCCRLPALSTATERYLFEFGLLDTATSAISNGVYLRYSDNVNSGKFVLVTEASNVETASNTAYTVAGNTWMRLGIEVDAAGANATAFVDGVAIGTASSGFPTSSNLITLATRIDKVVHTAAASVLHTDYMKMVWTPTTAR